MDERSNDEIMAWLGRIRALDEASLERLAPLLDTSDALDSLRGLLGMVPAFAGDVRDLLLLPRNECVSAVFRLRTATAFLAGDREMALTLDAWCREQLDEIAQRDPDSANRLAAWCIETVAKLSEVSSGEAVSSLLRCICNGRCRWDDGE